MEYGSVKSLPSQVLTDSTKLKGNKEERWFILMAHILFVTLVCFALYFFAERNLGDTGWRIFCMLNRELPCASHGRWILLIHQIPANLAISAGLQLKPILMIHAVSYVFIFYICFLYCYYRLGNKALAVAILLSSVLSVGFVYFSWPDLEKLLIMPLTIVFAALLQKQHHPKVELAIAYPILLFLILTGHPVAILTVSFLFVWHTITKRKFNFYVLTCIAIIYVYFKMSMDSYEQGVMPELRLATIIDLSGLPLLGERLFSMLANNFFIWMLAVVLLIRQLRQRYTLRFLALLGFMAGYVWMILQFGLKEQQEPYLIPLVGVILILTMQLIGNDLALHRRMLVVYLITFLVNLVSIYASRHQAQQKLALLDYAIEQTNELDGCCYILDREFIDLFPRADGSGFWYAESLVRSNINDSRQIALISAPNLRHNLRQLDNFIAPDVLADYFPEGLEEIPDSLLSEYANTYYAQEFLGDGFKLFFYKEMNPHYFEDFELDFRWLNEPDV